MMPGQNVRYEGRTYLVHSMSSTFLIGPGGIPTAATDYGLFRNGKLTYVTVSHAPGTLSPITAAPKEES